VIAHAVHETGRREIIGLDIGEAETEAFWTEFLRSLVARGLLGVQLAISDAHPGLKAALATVLGARVISDGIEVARRRAATAGRGRCRIPNAGRQRRAAGARNSATSLPSPSRRRTASPARSSQARA
jgi:putative transposase